HRAAPGKPGLAWRAAARAFAVRELLLQEARRLGLEPKPRLVGPGRREATEEALVRAVIERRVQASVPDEAACRAFHAAHRDLFRSPPLYAASHILLAAAPGTPERADARAVAREILARLAARPQAFEDLARAHSACPSREAGGRLGQLAPGDTVPEFETALATMAVGTITPEPVETRYGFHIIRLDDRAEGAELPFDLARPRVRETMERAAWARAAKALVAELVAAAEITGIDFPRVA
ncbi:MAG TPA: peptidylprolyl isomerase, partial [Amaricoccus sp.]|uniref:peptidylprolyl isomerase n=1 Tax=Amaricoccus sp. TaxID=1872485 RepID=UPI002BDB924F